MSDKIVTAAMTTEYWALLPLSLALHNLVTHGAIWAG